MTFEEFKALPKPEHDEFISKLLQAIHNDPVCFMHAEIVVTAAEKAGMFDKVKFGNG